MATGTGVLVVAEVSANGALRAVSWEMLTAARAIAAAHGGEVVGLVAGIGIADAAAQWGSGGADRLLVADDARLAGNLPGPMAAALQQAIAHVNPAVVLLPGTTAGRDYAPLVAARLGIGLAADCTEIAVTDQRAPRALTRLPISGSSETARSGASVVAAIPLIGFHLSF